jgi:hypothetical protein
MSIILQEGEEKHVRLTFRLFVQVIQSDINFIIKSALKVGFMDGPMNRAQLVADVLKK